MTTLLASRPAIALHLFIWTIGLAFAAVLAIVADEPAQHLPACEWEDSRNCSWNATTSGNGAGVSFVDVDGVTYTVAGAR